MFLKNDKIFAIALIWTGLTGCHTNLVRDVEGNVYKTVNIGTQVWMAENLKTTKFNDGTSIPLVTNYDSWAALTTPAYCWYNNDSSNKEVYGALYNWYAVNTNKLCPEGWHIPADSEWTTLMDYLGDSKNAGGLLKEKGTHHWKTPNTGATDKIGFTALPGGYRSYNGSFNWIRISGYWWSSTEDSKFKIYFWQLRFKSGQIFPYYSEKSNGFCVRCLQD
jgi:uncharacterized protein (TIGR02145 family)